MPDAKGIIKKVHQAAVEAVESTKPVNVCFGMIDDRNASLEDQMTQAQEAMCEIYEMMA